MSKTVITILALLGLALNGEAKEKETVSSKKAAAALEKIAKEEKKQTRILKRIEAQKRAEARKAARKKNFDLMRDLAERGPINRHTSSN